MTIGLLQDTEVVVVRRPTVMLALTVEPLFPSTELEEA